MCMPADYWKTTTTTPGQNSAPQMGSPPLGDGLSQRARIAIAGRQRQIDAEVERASTGR